MCGLLYAEYTFVFYLSFHKFFQRLNRDKRIILLSINGVAYE